jgi:ribonucrease Y
MNSLPVPALIGAIAVLSVALGYFLGGRNGVAREREQQVRSRTTAEETATRLIDEAKREAETIRKGAVVAGKEELIQLREQFEGEVRKRRGEVEREERRVQDREDLLERRAEGLDGRERELTQRAQSLDARDARIVDREAEAERLVSDQQRRLEQLAGLSVDDAKAEIVRRYEDQALADAASRLREIRESAKRNADREARKIVALAVQRVAAEPRPRPRSARCRCRTTK